MLRSVFGDHVRLVNLPVNDFGGPKTGGLTAQSVYQINQVADGLIIGPGNLFENGALQVDLNALGALSVPAMLFSVSMGRVFERTGRLAISNRFVVTGNDGDPVSDLRASAGP